MAQGRFRAAYTPESEKRPNPQTSNPSEKHGHVMQRSL